MDGCATVQGRGSVKRRKFKRSSSTYRSINFKDQVRQVMLGYMSRAIIVLDDKCNKWVHNKGVKLYTCDSGAHELQLCNLEQFTVPITILSRCTKCNCNYNVGSIEHLYYILCPACLYIPTFGEEIAIDYSCEIQQFRGIPIDTESITPGSTKLASGQIGSRFHQYENAIEVNSQSEQGDFSNCKSISTLAMKEYLHGRIKLIVYAIKCPECELYTEYRWLQQTRCNAWCLNELIDCSDYLQLGADDRAITSAELFLECKACGLESPAPLWKLYTQAQCPRLECKKYLMDWDEIKFRRVIRNFKFPSGAEIDVASAFDEKETWILESKTTRRLMELANERTSVPRIKRVEFHENIDVNNVQNPLDVTSSYGSDNFYPLVDSDEQPETSYLSNSDDSLKLVNNEKFDWSRRVIAIDCECKLSFLSDNPGIITWAAYGETEKGDSGTIDEVRWVLNESAHMSYYSLARNGITRMMLDRHKPYQESIGQSRQLLVDKYTGYVLLHHGLKYRRAFGYINEQTIYNDEESGIIFIDTRQIFKDARGRSIPLSVLAERHLNVMKKMPHSPREDASNLFKLWMLLVEGPQNLLPRCYDVPERPALPLCHRKGTVLIVVCFCELKKHCRCPCKGLYTRNFSNCYCNCICAETPVGFETADSFENYVRENQYELPYAKRYK